MKIRSLEALESFLQKDLAWRKHEITNLNNLVETSKKKAKVMLVRASITLFYAHWEGFVKKACQAYLQFLICSGFKNRQLQPNFSHLSIGSSFQSDFNVRSYKSQRMIFEHVATCGDMKFSVDPVKVADTGQNLKSEILFELMQKVGLESDFFLTRQQNIDTQLLRLRNLIAHGEKVDDQDLLSAYSGLNLQVMEMLDCFHNLVVNAAANEEYLIKN